MADVGASPEVREARAEDLPRIVELLDQLGETAGREDFAGDEARYRAAYAAMLAGDAGQRLFVVEHEGRVAGTAVLIVVPNLSHHGAPWAAVENVVVEASLRGRGLGEALMARLVDEARRAGCYKVSLTSAKRRGDAHRFYERIGFVRTHEGFRVEL